jgi:hypothetical protein
MLAAIFAAMQKVNKLIDLAFFMNSAALVYGRAATSRAGQYVLRSRSRPLEAARRYTASDMPGRTLPTKISLPVEA